MNRPLNSFRAHAPPGVGILGVVGGDGRFVVTRDAKGAPWLAAGERVSVWEAKGGRAHTASRVPAHQPGGVNTQEAERVSVRERKSGVEGTKKSHTVAVLEGMKQVGGGRTGGPSRSIATPSTPSFTPSSTAPPPLDAPAPASASAVREAGGGGAHTAPGVPAHQPSGAHPQAGEMSAPALASSNGMREGGGLGGRPGVGERSADAELQQPRAPSFSFLSVDPTGGAEPPTRVDHAGGATPPRRVDPTGGVQDDPGKSRRREGLSGVGECSVDAASLLGDGPTGPSWAGSASVLHGGGGAPARLGGTGREGWVHARDTGAWAANLQEEAEEEEVSRGRARALGSTTTTGADNVGWASEIESSPGAGAGAGAGVGAVAVAGSGEGGGAEWEAQNESSSKVVWESENESSPAALLAAFFAYYAQVGF
ncbi:hypothetical protein T484DRAFT_1846636 [Baffinella frigidus]|nr:hypothetical protein T484DRAFT_1846636 [Cryptophyta sp. CCMP2293]